MVVDPDLTRLHLVGSIAQRAKKALELIVKKNGTLRCIEQVKRLDRALKLFNENLLGEVQVYISEPEKKLQLSKRIRELRTAFRQKIDRLGEEEVERIFVRVHDLPPRIRHLIFGQRFNNSERCPLRKLVTQNEKEMIGNIRMGKILLPIFVRALAKEGLSIGMSEEEVEECFGPEKVRTVIYLKDFKTEKDIGTGVEVVIEGSDEKLYRSITCSNGAHFELPPGRCKIIRPKLHSPCSSDGYECIFLETRRQYEAHTFYVVGLK